VRTTPLPLCSISAGTPVLIGASAGHFWFSDLKRMASGRVLCCVGTLPDKSADPGHSARVLFSDDCGENLARAPGANHSRGIQYRPAGRPSPHFLRPAWQRPGRCPRPQRPRGCRVCRADSSDEAFARVVSVGRVRRKRRSNTAIGLDFFVDTVDRVAARGQCHSPPVRFSQPPCGLSGQAVPAVAEPVEAPRWNGLPRSPTPAPAPTFSSTPPPPVRYP